MTIIPIGPSCDEYTLCLKQIQFRDSEDRLKNETFHLQQKTQTKKNGHLGGLGVTNVMPTLNSCPWNVKLSECSHLKSTPGLVFWHKVHLQTPQSQGKMNHPNEFIPKEFFRNSSGKKKQQEQYTFFVVTIWVFPKIGVPQNGMIYNGNPYWNGWFGLYHHFRKHTYGTPTNRDLKQKNTSKRLPTWPICCSKSMDPNSQGVMEMMAFMMAVSGSCTSASILPNSQTGGFIWMFPQIGGFSPKSSIFMGFSITNHPFWDITIFGNAHISSCLLAVAQNLPCILNAGVGRGHEEKNGFMSSLETAHSAFSVDVFVSAEPSKQHFNIDWTWCKFWRDK